MTRLPESDTDAASLFAPRTAPPKAAERRTEPVSADCGGAERSAARGASPPESFRVHADLEICVVGLGYIGLPTASLLGTRGYTVHGVDLAQSVVDTINMGRIHIVEPDLDILVRSAVQSGRLDAATAPVPADVFMIAVPTPLDDERRPDLSAVEAATRAIASVLRPGNLVILESTSPVGTTEELVARILREEGGDAGSAVLVAYCPERVLPGRVLTELVENDRVVGGVDRPSTEAAVAFYESFVRGDVIATDARTAEMVKLTENASRDSQIAFANELSVLCEGEGVDVWELIRLANRHPRVQILDPGPGVGGHCIAVDPWFLVHRAPEDAKLIRAAREVNDSMPGRVVDHVRRRAAELTEPVIACLGLAFKPDVDDLRESPAVEIARRITAERLGTVLAVEPHIREHPEFELVELGEALERADIVLVLVDHTEFRKLSREHLHGKQLIDTRGLFR